MRGAQLHGTRRVRPILLPALQPMDLPAGQGIAGRRPVRRLALPDLRRTTEAVEQPHGTAPRHHVERLVPGAQRALPVARLRPDRGEPRPVQETLQSGVDGTEGTGE